MESKTMRKEPTKGYGANYINVQERESQDTYERDDQETSITGGTCHEHEGEGSSNLTDFHTKQGDERDQPNKIRNSTRHEEENEPHSSPGHSWGPK